MSCSRRTMASSKATSACCSRGPYHVDALDARPTRMATGAERRRHPGRSRPSRSAMSTSYRRSARSPARRSPRWAQGRTSARRPRARTGNGPSPSGTASSPTSACICARSTATGGSVPPTKPARSTKGPRASSTRLAEDPLQWRNLWDDPAYRARRDELVTDLYDNLPPGPRPSSRSKHRYDRRHRGAHRRSTEGSVAL